MFINFYLFIHFIDIAEYESCVWKSLHDNHFNRIERVQRKLSRNCDAGQTCMIFFHTKTDNALIRLATMCSRRAISCVMFLLNILSGRLYMPGLLSLVNVNCSQNRIRGGNFLRIDFHRSNYGST
jgi:hypothetical protein